MRTQTSLIVPVRMYDGSSIPRATVTLDSQDGGGTTQLQYDPDAKVYFTDGQPAGKYELQVSAPCLLAENRSLFLAAGKNREPFYLGPSGLSCFYRGKVRIPFEKHCDLVGVALAKRPSAKEEHELEAFAGDLGLAPVEVPEPVRDDRGRVFRLKKDKETPPDEFAEHSLVHRMGPVIRLADDSLSFLTNQLIVKFEADVSEQESNAILQQFRLQKIRAFPYSQNTFLVYRPGPADLELLKTALQLLQHGRDRHPVVYAEPNLVTTAVDAQLKPQDHLYDDQWTMPHVGFEHAWANLAGIDATKGYGDPDVLIAILDQGLKSLDMDVFSDPYHPDFKPTVSDGRKKIDTFYNFADMHPGNIDPNWPSDELQDHGAWVSGVATALADNPVPGVSEFEGIAGAAPNCRVLSLMRGMQASDSRYADAYIWMAGFDPGWFKDGIDYKTDEFPSVPGQGADVINNSFMRGWFENPSILKAAFDFITSYGRGGKGCVLVFAAGNKDEDLDVTDSAPMATYPRTIGVAASTKEGDSGDKDTKTNYSNHGKKLDVCAPSAEKLNTPTIAPIMTAAPVEWGNTKGHDEAPTKDYDYDFTGTSAAVPLVSGLSALMLSMNPDLTWIQVRKILRETAVKTLPSGAMLPDGDWTPDPPQYSRYYAYGRIDANAAVQESKVRLSADLADVADLWIKEHFADDGNVPSYPTYSPDVWVRNLPPGLDPGPTDVHQSPIRGQDNWAYARVRNRGGQDSSEAYVRLLITRWAGTQYVYPDDFMPTVEPSQNPTSPQGMVPGSYLVGESEEVSVPADGEEIVQFLWPQQLIPDQFVTVNGTPYSWADSCLLVDVTPHDGPPPTGNLTADNNNLCQRNLTIVDVTNQTEVNLLFYVGHRRNLLKNLELLISRKGLSADVRLLLDYVDPRTTRAVQRALARITLPRYHLTPTTRGRRTLFSLPARNRVEAPILRDPGEYQPLALVIGNLGSLAVGTHRIEVVQRVPRGPIQGLLRFHLVKR